MSSLKEMNVNSGVIAKFEKVSFDQYLKDWRNLYGDDTPEEKIRDVYNNITIPERSTVDSAGYDFFTPFSFAISQHDSIIVPTGIRAEINSDWFLMAVPRSGLGFKNKLVLANTVGIIDSDYYYANNEGHIMIKLVYEGIQNTIHVDLTNDDHAIYTVKRTSPLPMLKIECGKAFCQGIFLRYGKAVENDRVKAQRTGGFGSTD